MTISITQAGALQLQHLVPGERVKLDCGPNDYVFEVDDERKLMLDTNASDMPSRLLTIIRNNRNAQEVLCNQDIEMDEMRVYLYLPMVNTVWRSQSYTLYPKAPCASMDEVQGELYRTESVRRITPLDGTEPDNASDSMKESA